MTYGYVEDLPLPDVTVREGDLDPIDFTLKSNGVVVNLSGQSLEMVIQGTRSASGPTTYSTSGSNLVISNAAAGIVTLLPTTATFSTAIEPYRAYFNITTGGTVRSIPQAGDIWIRVIKKFA